MKRTPFPPLFWIGNVIEVLERFAYYGLYMGFGIYVTKAVADGGLGWEKGQLSDIQTLFLLLSYSVPMVSGILADRYGFKRLLMLSYLLYLPGFLLLLWARSFIGVVAVMALIGIAAGVFKPLIAGTVRLTTDHTNRTLGFGIFYLMVNVGAFFGPMTAGALRTHHWNWAFLASAVAVVAMIVITALFYRDPIDPTAATGRRPELLAQLREIWPYLKDPKILLFIIIFGVFIEIPFWAFFNIVAVFVDEHVRTDILYDMFARVLGPTVVGWFSTVDENGVHRIAGETLAHTALYIIVLQMFVTRTMERMRSVPAVATGIFLMVLGCVGLFFSAGSMPLLMFVGILLFAIGEMGCMPRFEQYLISMLPPEKTGLGGGLLRIPVAIGAFSGSIMTRAYGWFEQAGDPAAIWLVQGGCLLLGFVALLGYDRVFHAAEID